MSIFDNIVFDEFTLLEGKQADEYRKRKSDEKAASDKVDKDRRNRRYEGIEKDIHGKFVGNTTKNISRKEYKNLTDDEFDKYCDSRSDDEMRADSAAIVANRNRGKGDFNTRFDAINRDMRRHPDKWHSSSSYNKVKTERD